MNIFVSCANAFATSKQSSELASAPFRAVRLEKERLQNRFQALASFQLQCEGFAERPALLPLDQQISGKHAESCASAWRLGGHGTPSRLRKGA